MQIACLDLEGVLIPEIWVNVAEKTGVEELKLTTRDIPDYDELMTRRLGVLEREGITISVFQDVVAGLTPLDGADDFLSWLRERYQVVVLSDTFYEFAFPLLRQLGFPTVFCHKLSISDAGFITDYHLRMPDQKREAVKRFHEINFQTIATGDSYNDTTMLSEAGRGILFCPPQNVIDEFPQYPVATDYKQLASEFERASEELAGE
ncbi:MAG: bifunctional phosphoserine phosphatase/homoserine phosphotransferase ThrH [Verrucomicrobiota bacterium]